MLILPPRQVIWLEPKSCNKVRNSNARAGQRKSSWRTNPVERLDYLLIPSLQLLIIIEFKGIKEGYFKFFKII